MAVGKKAADTGIDESRPGRVGDVAARAGPSLGVVGKARVCRSPDVAGGEIGEQRIFARPAVAVAGVALRLSPEQSVARLLLRRELRLACLNRVELRREVRHLRGGFVA